MLRHKHWQNIKDDADFKDYNKGSFDLLMLPISSPYSESSSRLIEKWEKNRGLSLSLFTQNNICVNRISLRRGARTTVTVAATKGQTLDDFTASLKYPQTIIGFVYTVT